MSYGGWGDFGQSCLAEQNTVYQLRRAPKKELCLNVLKQGSLLSAGGWKALNGLPSFRAALCNTCISCLSIISSQHTGL